METIRILKVIRIVGSYLTRIIVFSNSITLPLLRYVASSMHDIFLSMQEVRANYGGGGGIIKRR